MKAVIMAGGAGTRLRPLTCTMPKPMAPLCGRPVLEYIMDLLQSHGVEDAAVTLKYMPEVIRNHFPQEQYKKLNLRFVEEEEPLGTAGSVKNAARDYQEPFVVVSGDAICDYELDKIMKYHISAGAAATIVVTHVDDPREYGLVRFDGEGRVLGFLEKPGWGQAVCNTANTGIYILNPECLSLIPDKQAFDFAKDLFPEMMQRNMPLFAYQASGYWCDIGGLDAYLKCQRDMLEGRVHCRMPAQVAHGIYAKDQLPSGEYNLIPPVYIGGQVEIESGACVGPNSVIEDGCRIGREAKVRGSIMLGDSYVARYANLTGAVLCEGASVKTGGRLFEGSVLGAGAVVGADAGIKPGVYVWPGKLVADGAEAVEHVKYGAMHRELFDDGGIIGEDGVELTPETCARIGSAIGSTKLGARIGVACVPQKAARAKELALMSGVMASGGHVWNFGECFEAQLSFFTAFCGLGMGVFITEQGIQLCGEGGLPMPRYLEREIESRYTRREFNRCSSDTCRDIADMGSVRMMYQQELCRQAPNGLNGQFVRIQCENEEIVRLMTDCLNRMGCEDSDGLEFCLNVQGTRLVARTESREVLPNEKLLTICCLHEMKNGHDVALPYDAPEYLTSLAYGFSCRAVRYLSCPADESDREARQISRRQIWVRDGLFMAVKLLAIMEERGTSLDELAQELPPFSVARRMVAVDIPPSRLFGLFGAQGGGKTIGGTQEGIVLQRREGRLLITPSRAGRHIRLMAEAADMETAQELCADIGDKLLHAALDTAEDKR